MTRQPSSGIVDKEDLSDSQVSDFLRSHPDFFERHTAVLSDLRVPHNTGADASLIERQVEVLRKQQRRLHQRIQELINISRENTDISERIHRFNLKVMDCFGLPSVVKAIKSSLLHEFGLDIVGLKLFSLYRGQEPLPAELKNIYCTALELKSPVLQALMQYQEPICGHLKPEFSKIVFAGTGRDTQSVATLPLGIGVVALGSFDARRFHSGMATHFLKNLAEIIARKLHPHSYRPA